MHPPDTVVGEEAKTGRSTKAAPGAPIASASHVQRRYGSLLALSDVTFELRERGQNVPGVDQAGLWQSLIALAAIVVLGSALTAVLLARQDVA